MTSPSLPPPSSKIPGKSSGSGLYLLGIIVLALGALGLFAWKRSRTTVVEVQPGPVASASSAPTQEALPQLYAPPPPPKVDDDADAGAKASSSGQPSGKGTGVAATAPGPCGGKCDGPGSPALQAALRSTAQSAQGCYNRALRNSEASGRLVVSVQVASNGAVCSASLAEDAVHSGEIASCVLGRFRGHTFPPPQGGCATVNIPINFAIKQ